MTHGLFYTLVHSTDLGKKFVEGYCYEKHFHCRCFGCVDEYFLCR